MKFNVTIASPSPLIALGSLIFNGTGIWVDSNPTTTAVPYTVELDSINVNGTLQTNSNPTTLYSSSNLQNTENTNESHRLFVTPSSILDSVILEMDVNADTQDKIDDATWFDGQMTDGSVVVQGNWTTNECLGSGRSMNTCHTSSGPSASITYTFQGDAITVYGSLENARSRYTYSIDGSTPAIYSSSNGTLSAPSVVLVQLSNLGVGDHVLTFASVPIDGQSRAEIDYVVLYHGSQSLISSNETAEGAPKPVKIYLILGILGGCMLIAIVFLTVLHIRQKRQGLPTFTTYTGGDSHSPVTGPTAITFTKSQEADVESLRSDHSSITSLKKPTLQFPVSHQLQLPIAIQFPSETRTPNSNQNLFPVETQTQTPARTPNTTAALLNWLPASALPGSTAFDQPWVEQSSRYSIHPMADADEDPAAAVERAQKEGVSGFLAMLRRW